MKLKKIKAVDSATLYQIYRDDLPSRTYVLANPYSKKIHFDPTITDFDLYRLSVKSNEAFLKAAKQVGIFGGARVKDLCEVILLSGGFYYHLNRAFYNVFKHSLPTGFIGVRRILSKKPRAVVSYSNLEAVPPGNVSIIGDTIATGATLEYAIPYYLKHAPPVKKLVIFTLAGALPGAQKLAKLEKNIKKKYGTELYVFFADAIFGLADNQTDMHYLHPDTIAPEKSMRAAKRNLGPVLAKKMCVIWDWGQRNKDPMGHLKEVIKVGKKWGKPAKGIVEKAKQSLKKRNKSL